MRKEPVIRGGGRDVEEQPKLYTTHVCIKVYNFYRQRSFLFVVTIIIVEQVEQKCIKKQRAFTENIIIK